MLAKQAFPASGNFLIKAYENATRNPHGHLSIDFSQKTSDNIRVTTGWFSKENPIKVYNQKSSQCLSMGSNNPFVCCYILPEAIYNSLVSNKSTDKNIDQSKAGINTSHVSNNYEISNSSSNQIPIQENNEDEMGKKDEKKMFDQITPASNADETKEMQNDNSKINQNLPKEFDRVKNDDSKQINTIKKEKQIINNDKNKDRVKPKIPPFKLLFKKQKNKILNTKKIKFKNLNDANISNLNNLKSNVKTDDDTYQSFDNVSDNQKTQRKGKTNPSLPARKIKFKQLKKQRKIKHEVNSDNHVKLQINKKRKNLGKSYPIFAPKVTKLNKGDKRKNNFKFQDKLKKKKNDDIKRQPTQKNDDIPLWHL